MGGIEQSPCNHQDLVKILSLQQKSLTILAVFAAVLINIREGGYFIFSYWGVKAHCTLPMQSPSKNLKFILYIVVLSSVITIVFLRDFYCQFHYHGAESATYKMSGKYPLKQLLSEVIDHIL